MKWLRPLIFLSLCACATGNKNPYKVTFDQDVTLISENDQKQNLKKGQTATLSSKPMTVTRAGSNPVILLPLPSSGGSLNLRLPPSDNIAVNVKAEEKQAKAEGPDLVVEMNRIAQSILAIQNLLIERRADEALARIQAVRERIPGFSYIYFLEAGAYLAKDDLGKARQLAERALKEFPKDEAGQRFMEELSLLSGEVPRGRVK